MRKLAPVLLIGTLSMLFAEVFSGASQMWYVSGWGLLITFPLYSAHLLFFLNIAMKLRKTSLSQLYLFGVSRGKAILTCAIPYALYIVLPILSILITLSL